MYISNEDLYYHIRKYLTPSNFDDMVLFISRHCRDKDSLVEYINSRIDRDGIDAPTKILIINLTIQIYNTVEDSLCYLMAS